MILLQVAVGAQNARYYAVTSITTSTTTSTTAFAVAAAAIAAIAAIVAIVAATKNTTIRYCCHCCCCFCCKYIMCRCCCSCKCFVSHCEPHAPATSDTVLLPPLTASPTLLLKQLHVQEQRVTRCKARLAVLAPVVRLRMWPTRSICQLATRSVA